MPLNKKTNLNSINKKIYYMKTKLVQALSLLQGCSKEIRMKPYELRKILEASQNKVLANTIAKALTLINDDTKIHAEVRCTLSSVRLAKTYKLRLEITPLNKECFMGLSETIKLGEEIEEKIRMVCALTAKAIISVWLKRNNEIRGCFIQFFPSGTKQYEAFF